MDILRRDHLPAGALDSRLPALHAAESIGVRDSEAL